MEGQLSILPDAGIGIGLLCIGIMRAQCPYCLGERRNGFMGYSPAQISSLGFLMPLLIDAVKVTMCSRQASGHPETANVPRRLLDGREELNQPVRAKQPTGRMRKLKVMGLSTFRSGNRRVLLLPSIAAQPRQAAHC